MHFSDFPRVGDLFLGRYRVEAVLGAGGFARVYRAVQQDLERKVAIKVMRPAVDTTKDSTEETIAHIEEVEERFRREAKVISKFRSPHTVVVHDYGRTNGGLLYMTLEYVDGQTVSDLIKSHAPIDPARVVHIVKQVVRSLHEAHSFDILHRDIKPQNVMVYDHLDQTDLVKVLDFGIAKLMEVEEEAAVVEELTTDGVLVGTPRYMSPEQIRGDRLTPASDVYSLGLVAYEMLTGAKAVDETTTMRIIARHLDPSPLRVPQDALVGAGLREIVERMISKEPGDRYQSARELLKEFNAWDPEEPVVVPESLEFGSDVAETVKFEAQDPDEMAESTEPSDDSSPGDDVGETSVEEPPPVAEEEQEDPTLLSEREPSPEEMFFAADTQMLEAGEFPDDREEARPRAQFFHPSEERGETTGEITGELRQDRRAAWLPIAIVAVAAVLLLFVGVAFLSNSGSSEDEPTEPAGSTERPPPDEPSIAAVDPAGEMIEVEALDKPDEPDDAERIDVGADPAVSVGELADDDTASDSPGEDATSPDPADEAADDEPEPQPAKTTEKDDKPRRPARHRRRPKEKEKEKEKKEKRRFFPVE